MSTLRQPFFIIITLIFSVHQLLQKVLHIPISWFDDYLDPLLCMPILLTLLLAERRHIFGKGNDYKLSGMEVTLTVVSLSIIFEIIFPALTSKFTSDWGDVIAYITGGLFFYIVMNRSLQKA